MRHKGSIDNSSDYQQRLEPEDSAYYIDLAELPSEKSIKEKEVPNDMVSLTSSQRIKRFVNLK
jgi:hypothetical protein